MAVVRGRHFFERFLLGSEHDLSSVVFVLLLGSVPVWSFVSEPRFFVDVISLAFQDPHDGQRLSYLNPFTVAKTKLASAITMMALNNELP